MIALILAGGSGTRFWPMSTNKLPKQFLKLFNNKSMLQLTFERLEAIFCFEKIFIVTIKEQIPLIKEHIPNINDDNIIIEPFGMNTAPCISLSISYLKRKFDNNETVFVLPADHYIPNEQEFSSEIKQGIKYAENDVLLTYGITPTYPATGYGYIESGDDFQNGLFRVKHFKEKPDFCLASEFISKGNYFWNSGMFSWKINTIYDAFCKYAPNTIEITDKIVEKSLPELYSQVVREPIDIAIMEKADNVVVKPVSFQWSDVGNWYSLSELMSKDSNGNHINNENFTIESCNNAIFTNKKVALIGVNDIILVETDDAILLVNKNLTEKVKDVKIT